VTFLDWLYEYGTRHYLWLYALPAAVCLAYAAVDSAADYRDDLRKRDLEYYSPELKVGTVVWRVLLALCPAVNVLRALLRFLPRLVGRLVSAVEDLMSLPLVPARRKKP
jgi:hypothetical protein